MLAPRRAPASSGEVGGGYSMSSRGDMVGGVGLVDLVVVLDFSAVPADGDLDVGMVYLLVAS
jgi:hypothetical protein